MQPKVFGKFGKNKEKKTIQSQQDAYQNQYLESIKKSSPLNVMLFPSPRPPKYTTSSLGNGLGYLKRARNDTHIPVFVRKAEKPVRVVIYSHGNSEDLGSLSELLDEFDFAAQWRAIIIAYDYTGYGLSAGRSNESGIDDDMDDIFNFVVSLDVPTKQIFFFGQSIGTGPSTRICAQLCEKEGGDQPGGLLLVSPYTSIKEVAVDISKSQGKIQGGEQLAGILSKAAGGIVIQRWNSLDNMKKVKCPVLFVHGQEDDFIPCDHSKRLYEACAAEDKTLTLPVDSTHNAFDFEQDIVTPGSVFMNRATVGDDVSPADAVMPTIDIKFPADFHNIPDQIRMHQDLVFKEETDMGARLKDSVKYFLSGKD